MTLELKATSVSDSYYRREIRHENARFEGGLGANKVIVTDPGTMFNRM